MDNTYYQKYIKYKTKYIELKKIGGENELVECGCNNYNSIKYGFEISLICTNCTHEEKKHICDVENCTCTTAGELCTCNNKDNINKHEPKHICREIITEK